MISRVAKALGNFGNTICLWTHAGTASIISGILFYCVTPAASQPSSSDLVWTQTVPARDDQNFGSLRQTDSGFLAVRFSADSPWDSVVSISEDGVKWAAVYQSPRIFLTDAVYGNGIHVAIGQNGHIVRSTHGYTWETVNSGITENLRSVVWSGEAFIAVGEAGSILRSVDAFSWQATKPAGEVTLQNIFKTDQELAAIGSNGTLLRSVDHGQSWETLPTSSTYSLQKGLRIPGGLLFYSDAGSSKKFVLRSDSGVITETNYPLGGNLISMSEGPSGRYLLTNDRGGIFASSDGISWEQMELSMREGGADLGGASIAATADGWLLAGLRGEIIRFSDGISWQKPYETERAVRAIVRTATGWYTVGDGGNISFSEDGITWGTATGPGFSYSFTAAVAWNGGVLAVSSGGKGYWFGADSDSTYPTIGTTATNLQGVASSGNRLVAVGKTGEIYRLASSGSWTKCISGTTEDLLSVEYALGKFHAVGSGGTILTSVDGLDWSPQISGTTGDLLRIRHTAEGFFAVGKEGLILQSSDGATWQTRASGVTADLMAVAVLPDAVYILGAKGTVLKSSDGVEWSDETPGHESFVGNFTDATSEDGRLIVVAQQSSNFGVRGTIRRSFYSTGSVRETNPGSVVNGLGYSHGTFIRVGNGGTLQTSTDGDKWLPRRSSVKFDLWDVASSPDLIAATGNGGIIISSNGSDWRLADSSGLGFRRIFHGGGLWLACGYSGALMISNDGLTWRPPTDPNKAISTSHLSGISWGDGRFVICGESGTMLVSTDGEIWTRLTRPTSANVYGVGWTGSGFIAGVTGTNYQVLRSADGLSWTVTPGSPIAFGNMIKAIGDRCFMVDQYDQLFSTADGLSWQSHRQGYNSYNFHASLYESASAGIAGTPENLMTVTGPGVCAHSRDGHQWIYGDGVMPQYFVNIFRARDRFVALSAHNVLHTTHDGVRWTRHRTSSVATKQLIAFADNGSRSIVVGDAVLWSDDFWNWTEVADPPTTQLTVAAWTGERFIAGGTDNALYASTDGSSWQKVAQFLSRVHSITTQAGVLLAWTPSQIFTSLDGLQWTPYNTTLTPSRYSTAYQDEYGLVASGNLYIATSGDSTNWTESFMSGTSFGKISRGGNGTYFAVTGRFDSTDTSLHTSQDAANWKPTEIRLPDSPLGIAASADRVIIVHRGGEILIGTNPSSPAFQRDLLGQGHSLGEDLTPGGDPDGDQIPNIVARFFGIPIGAPATSTERSRIPSMVFDPIHGHRVRLSFPESPPAYLKLILEESDDLLIWRQTATRTPNGLWASERAITSATVSDGFESIEIGIDPISSSAPPLFFRVRVADIP